MSTVCLSESAVKIRHDVIIITFRPSLAFPRKTDTRKMWNSKGHHPVGSHHRSSGGAEWSCVAGL